MIGNDGGMIGNDGGMIGNDGGMIPPPHRSIIVPKLEEKSRPSKLRNLPQLQIAQKCIPESCFEFREEYNDSFPLLIISQTEFRWAYKQKEKE